MLTAFKTPVGILFHCILCAQPLASTITQRSVCFCHSSSLSERISHPLLLQLFTAFLLNSTIRSSFALFHPAIILFLYFFSLWSYFSTFLFSLLSILVSSFYLCYTFHKSLIYTVRFSFPPSYSIVTHFQRRRRISCELNLPAVKRWLRRAANVRVK